MSFFTLKHQISKGNSNLYKLISKYCGLISIHKAFFKIDSINDNNNNNTLLQKWQVNNDGILLQQW